MRKYLIFILLLFAIHSYGTHYYFSNSGSDGNTGTSEGQAWETFDKFRSIVNGLSPADTVSFARGSVWDTSYVYINGLNGTLGNEIIFNSYGTGAKPKFSGYKELGTFTDLGSDVWQIIDTDLPDDIRQHIKVGIIDDWITNVGNYLLINDVPYSISKYPDSGYLNENGVSVDDESYYDISESLTANAYNGGIANIHCIDWVVNQNRITTNTVNRINLNTSDWFPGNDLSQGDSYVLKSFITNDSNAFSINGEWSHRIDTLRVYYTGNLNSQTVKFSTVDSVLSINNSSYLKFDGIVFEGGNKFTNKLYDADNITFNNCRIQYTPHSAFMNYSCDGLIYTYDTIYGANGMALNNQYCGDIQIKYCDFKRIGIDEGLGSGIDNEISGFNAIQFRNNETGAKNIVLDCSFDSIGYAAIAIKNPQATADSFYVRRSLFKNTMQYLADGGSIYIDGTSDNTFKQIKNCIFINSYGNPDFHKELKKFSFHPYLDVGGTDNYVIDSCVFIDHTSGIYYNGGNNNSIRNNIFFKSDGNITSDKFRSAWYGGDADYSQSNNTFYQNIVIYRDSADYGITWNYSPALNVNGSDSDSNTFVSPINPTDTLIIGYMEDWGTLNYYTQSEAISVFGWEDNSTYNLQSWDYSDVSGITRDQFTTIFCNQTDSEKTFYFNGVRKDVTGTNHTGNITVPANYGISLFYVSGLPDDNYYQLYGQQYKNININNKILYIIHQSVTKQLIIYQ